MMEGLGRLFDLSAGAALVDAHTGPGPVTGLRVSLKNASGVTVVVFKGAGTATQDPVLTFSQNTAATAGTQTTTAPLLDHFYKKAATTLTGAETWTKVTQTASNVVTLTGESTNQGIYALFVAAGDQTVRTDPYLEVDIGSVAASQLVSVLYVLHDLEVQRAPVRQASSQS